ncbi:MAG: two-component system response regulator [Candidatus Cloacimonadota bacterium]|nr:MAG: two-component system response regulator [Candidatus Cloacimonadota bacterium]
MNILVCDDDKSLARIIQIQLQGYGNKVELSYDGEECLIKLSTKNYDVCILDLNMPKKNGIQVLESFKRNLPCPIILLTAYEKLDLAIQAMKLGAFDYLTKPFDAIKLQHTIKIARYQWDLSKENEKLKKELFKKENLEFIAIEDSKLQKIIDLAALSDEAIYISGETGTGKDYLANYIHSISKRNKYNFLALNCAAIPENLLESELFGHVRGSFTGAIKNKIGILQEVGQGTLLLDEIGDMPLAIQSKILRVLENRSYRRLGDIKDSTFDGRILSASHKNLNDLVKEGLFREDLLYRLNTIPILLPPLRERTKEIDIYLKKFLPNKNLQDSALKYLKECYWRGNIRELKNYCARLNIFIQSIDITKKQLIELEELLIKQKNKPSQFTLPQEAINIEDSIDDLLLQALNRCNQNQSKAGELLGLSRQQVIHRMRKWKNLKNI